MGWDILKVYAAYLAVTLIFIVLVLRACYFCFVAKVDPIKAITKPPIAVNRVLEFLKKKKNRKIMESCS